MCTVLLPPGVNPIAVKKVYIYIIFRVTFKASDATAGHCAAFSGECRTADVSLCFVFSICFRVLMFFG
jgi:hypothetical protein